MKKLILIFYLCFSTVMLLTSCGGSGNGDEKTNTRKMDAKLDTLITNLAACKEQNTNCDAYLNASNVISLMAKDSSVKNLIDDLFNGIAQSTSSSRSAACAHAINFWTNNWDYYKNPAYGRIVLDALKKEKYDENSYVGSTLGQLLSGWLVSNDTALLNDIYVVVKDVNTEKRGRMEIIRLAGKESFAKPGLLDILVDLANNQNELEEVRVTCLNVLWRTEESAQYQKIENMYLALLTSSSTAIVGASLDGLGYMRSAIAYSKVLETIEKYGANEDYCSVSGRSLKSYISYEPKEGIDSKKAFKLAVKMANNKTLKAYSRSNYIYAIEAFGGNEGKSALTKLSAGSEIEIADPAKQALQRLKNNSL
jgi:hypothetical protein